LHADELADKRRDSLRRLSADGVLLAVADAAEGAAYINACGFAHKDLKEQNILLFKESHVGASGTRLVLRAKVADLGITGRLEQRRDEEALL
jgi:serine/threonine protein kinase